ncbi:efflux RND transporter periplasmic adaptor subunit [Pontitalea aquivivens]|uniref:efflux RND transporter periplasmic adaptor subunit n=1 Tax=Pontitalea aquivivens TaxID=3388663 RepID=UPI003970AE58
MKLVPIINAVLVSATLYALVFERDRLMAFAGRDPVPATDAAAGPVAEPGAGAVAVLVQRSQARPVDQGVLTRGQTEAARRVEMRAETGGRVISAPLARGTQVAAGDVLCRLDPGTRPALLAEAEARLTEARLSATAADRLQEGGFRSETAAAGARAALQAAEAGVIAARTEIGRLTITAPFAGILEQDSAELGTLLAPGGACATVIALDPIRLVGFVPETQVDRLAPGARVGARLASGRQVTGSVTFLSRAADPATRTFRIEAEVANPDLSIREGQTIEIVIQTEGARAHLLPASALTLDDQGRLGLRLAQDGRAVFAPVQLLRDTPQGVWLTGLPDDAQVIIRGQDYVTDGTALAITHAGATP